MYQVEFTEILNSGFLSFLGVEFLIEFSFDPEDEINVIQILADRAGNSITGTFEGEGTFDSVGSGDVTFAR